MSYRIRAAQNYEINLSPDYNPDAPRLWADFNCDGAVDFDDLVLLSQYYDLSLFA
jgi:hypothetical protein